MILPNLFWPTNFNLPMWPDQYWPKDPDSTGGGGAAPDFRIYMKIVAAPVWR